MVKDKKLCYSRIISLLKLALMYFDDYERHRHSVTKLCVHLIFTTKYRRKVMTPDVLEEIKNVLIATARKIECEPIEVNGEADHIHILLRIPPTLSVSSVVNALKTVSSRLIRSKYPNILHGGKTGLFWSRSYFAASAGGVTIDILKKYVEQQSVK